MNGGQYEHAGRRLLPWSSPEGKPCYLVGSGTGLVSRLADEIETIQLGMADELLGHAAELLSEPRATSHELRYLAGRLRESLLDVRRVAESRGTRPARADPAADTAVEKS
ncbi:hypothetical protein [Streptomyces olivochromogenes]|uniref:hypothetical protein n=1 Tax=Streptomyces olivochromogenes TaxID=1963 RepID=UPI001F3A6766|nr:hypothetical protein [Streptomyces olivochromogenes]MCF3135030.1 hypothetical protein [Streptomyces olivochromogenes]